MNHSSSGSTPRSPKSPATVPEIDQEVGSAQVSAEASPPSPVLVPVENALNNIPHEFKMLKYEYHGAMGAKVFWLAIFTVGPVIIGLKTDFDLFALQFSAATAVYVFYHIIGIYLWLHVRRLEARLEISGPESIRSDLKNSRRLDGVRNTTGIVVAILLFLTVLAKASFVYGEKSAKIPFPEFALRLLGVARGPLVQEVPPVSQSSTLIVQVIGAGRKPISGVGLAVRSGIEDKIIAAGTTDESGIARLSVVKGWVVLDAFLSRESVQFKYARVLKIETLPDAVEIDIGDAAWQSGASASVEATNPGFLILGARFRLAKELGTHFALNGEGARIILGKEVDYNGNKGLWNNGVRSGGKTFDPSEWQETVGHWAYVIQPAIHGSSGGSFTSLTSYDRAAMSFGLLLYSAHLPERGLVRLLKIALESEEGQGYFPNLVVYGGRISEFSGGTLVQLESAESTEGLMRVLNPTSEDIDDDELEYAARLIQWGGTELGQRQQVQLAVVEAKEAMSRASRWIELDGASDVTCAILIDILTTGRGTRKQIVSAMQSSNPNESLLAIGAKSYPAQVSELRALIKNLSLNGNLGRKSYRLTDSDFVDAMSGN